MEDAQQALGVLHSLYPAVDFHWIYGAYLQPSKTAVLSSIQAKGFLPSVLPDTTLPRPRTSPPPPRDGFVTRLQAVMLCLETSIQTPTLTSHLIITGGQGCGKTTAFQILASSVHSQLYSVALVAPSTSPTQGVARLRLPSDLTLDALVGARDPTSMEWADGKLTALLRRAIAYTMMPPTPYRGGEGVALPEHFWVLVQGTPPTQLFPTFLEFIRTSILFLPNGETLSLNPRIHFVFEVTNTHLSGVPAELLAACYVLHVEDDGLRVKPEPPPDDRPAYCEGDLSGALLSEQELRREFEQYDVNGNGWIDKEEFKEIYASFEHFGLAAEEEGRLEGLFAQFDQLGDGRLSYQEFAVLMLRLSRR
eukprot:NODE_2611_length_1138_cov_18.377844_g2491_i0.p1 GENE.NODE_2611_length_1138_cov_18.377844_g2491_i0~~NODE_2611_length_1138_cov_18.377844_g2491_i0.p1  ORF type:complete len:364 (-),score=85.49 NODE_2611_length_1138_cov_18.377844_g2491_i0:17-1108(-)